MGIERILYFLEKEGIDLVKDESIDLFVGIMGDGARTAAYKTIYDLRMKGFSVETDCLGRSVKAQMKYANKLNSRFSVIVGDDEVASGKCRLKNMETGEESEVTFEGIADIIGM